MFYNIKNFLYLNNLYIIIYSIFFKNTFIYFKKNNLLKNISFNNSYIFSEKNNFCLNKKFYFKNNFFFNYINSNYKKIYIKKINNLYCILLEMNLNKKFISNKCKYKLNSNNVVSLIKIFNKNYNFNLTNRDKCKILLKIYKKKINNFKINDIIGIKFILNNKNYYLIKDLNGKFHNIQLLINNNIFVFPIKIKFRISSGFNLYRLNPITNKIIPHKGIDIAVPINTKIFSIYNGKINNISYNKNAGKYLIINHKNKKFSKYMHLNKILVKKNQIVKRGDLIALSGNSGKSTGPHLHFEYWSNNKAKDPLLTCFYKLKYKKFKYNIEHIKKILINI